MKRHDIVSALMVLLILGSLVSCSYTSISCWLRGGTVIKNVFDWPTCVEVVRR